MLDLLSGPAGVNEPSNVTGQIEGSVVGVVHVDADDSVRVQRRLSLILHLSKFTSSVEDV